LLELGKALFGIGLIYYTGDWFLMNDIFPAGKYLLVAYFTLSVIIAFSFTKWDIKKDNSRSSWELA
jgi:hypothetical protein